MERQPLPSPLDLSPFSSGEAKAAGVPIGRIRARALLRPHHGARSHEPATDLDGRCRDYLPVLRDGQFFSHETAALLWGLPLPRWARTDARLHVSSAGRREPHRPGVVGHRLARADVRILRGLPVVSPVESWVECAGVLPLDDLTAMADALMGYWSKTPEARLRPREELESALREHRGGRGTRLLREAFDAARERVRSPKETATRLLLVRAGIREAEANAVVCDGRGHRLGESDLVWRAERVVVEYEGDQHRTDPVQFAKDIRRREAYAEAGWRTIRATRSDLRGDESLQLIRRVRATLARRSPR